MLPVPLVLPVAVITGALFAVAARFQFRVGHGPWARELRAVLIYEAIMAAPLLTYFLVVHRDWSWLYLVDARRLAWATLPLVLVAHAVAVVGGYLAGWALISARRDRELVGLLTILSVGVLVGIAVLSGRLGRSGTFEDFELGRAALASERKLGWALIAASLAHVAAISVVAYALWDQGKRHRES